MKELKIGEKSIRVRATPLALLFYKKEFGKDMLGDFIKMSEMENDPSKVDSVAILQMVWALAKADSFGKQFPSFETWLSELEIFDFSDSDILGMLTEEMAAGFFRGKSR